MVIVVPPAWIPVLKTTTNAKMEDVAVLRAHPIVKFPEIASVS